MVEGNTTPTSPMRSWCYPHSPHRSASTGRHVTAVTAKRNPDGTVTETG
jgi:hypothetical protein